MANEATKQQPDRSRLTAEQQVWVVTRLACFESPSDLRKAIKEEFGVELTPQALSYYDPTTVTGRELPAELQALFAETRGRFIEDAGAVPIAHQGYRLRELQRLFERNRERSPTVAAGLLEQAAKETGGMFTNRRELTGAGGKPIQTQQVPANLEETLANLTEEELATLERSFGKLAPDDGSAGGPEGG